MRNGVTARRAPLPAAPQVHCEDRQNGSFVQFSFVLVVETIGCLVDSIFRERVRECEKQLWLFSPV